MEYQKITSYQSLKSICRQCAEIGATALDFETTSLSPRDGKVRLVSLCNKRVKVVVDFDQIGGGFRNCAKLFNKGKWIVFNVGFEARWFLDAKCSPELLDVGNLRRAIIGGGSFSLANLVQWDLKKVMSKEQQRSDWSLPDLSQEQLDYAFKDAELTYELWKHWEAEADEGRWAGFRLLNDMHPAVIEMEDAGMLVDKTAHKKLIEAWYIAKTDRVKRIRELVGEDEVSNINSDGQWSDYFARTMPDKFLRGWTKTEKTGQLSMTTETLKRLAGAVPDTPLETFFDALSEYKTISKYINSFGENIINAANLNGGRIQARFNIGYARTCRFSSSGPNLQQIPRDKELLGKATSVRSSFIAGVGRKLVSLDYSGIELRVLALLSNDEQLLEDVVEGDVHSEVASVMAGRKIDKTKKADKDLRSKAKGVSFGIIYGSGANGLSSTMRVSPEKAQDYIDYWSTRYAKAFNYRFKMMSEAEKSRFIRMVDGGTIYMGRQPELPKCANYPVQRAALSVMARAIIRHKSSLTAARASGDQRLSRMLATIHDAIIDEASSRDAPHLLDMMHEDMVQGYLDVFPGTPTHNLVEGGFGANWGELG
tara:strand:+ start:3564 stop:5348 length:1785 start_codon:yes stop_codon:yes gene_type:complete